MGTLVRIILILCLWIFLMPGLSGAREMKIGYAQGFEPFSWQSEDGQAKGILIDFLDETLGKRMGIWIKHEIWPWARCQLMVKDGMVDAFFTIPTPKRRRYTIVSDSPLFTSDFLLYSGAGNPNIPTLKESRTLEALKKHYSLVHAYIRGAGWHATNLEDVVQLKEVDNSMDILSLLERHRADVYIEQQALVRYQVGKLGLEGAIVEIPNVMDSTSWHLCISKKSSFTEIMPAFNALLRQMAEDGSLAEVTERIFSKYR